MSIAGRSLLRSRNNMMEGLVLRGLNSTMGKIAVGLLVALGLVLLLSAEKLDTASLHQVDATVAATPYLTGAGGREMLLIPVREHQKLLVVQDFALQASGAAILTNALKPGDRIRVWLDASGRASFQNPAEGRRLQVILLSKGNTPLVSEAAYNRVLGKNARAGWWVLALGLAMIPYYFIGNPRIHPGWVFFMVLAAMGCWMIWGN